MMDPKVSVVMPCHTDKYLAEAVESILDQSFGDFELIAICDPDNMDVMRILYDFEDKRITVLEPPRHVNVSEKMNHVRRCVRGEYVARMDSDDISHPDRLKMQVDYLDTHPDVGAVGAQIDYIDENGNQLDSLSLPTSYAGILFALPRYNPIANSTTMIRSDLFRQLHYDEEITVVEDYDYWVRAVRATKIVNLPDYLVKYRIHPGQVSNNNQERDKWVPIIQERARGIFWDWLNGWFVGGMI
jgi:glycosyltransferase involved in cell wall biosynthesis